MDIKRILLLSSMALAALAFAAPAGAQAEVYLTKEGAKLKAEAKVTATSSNLTTSTEAGQITCANVTLHLELKNAGTEHLVLEQLGETTSSGCDLNVPGVGVFPTTVTDGTVGVGVGENKQITINTWGTGNTTTTFVSHMYLDTGHTEQISTCHLRGPVHLTATNTTDLLHVTGNLTKTEGEESCPTPTAHIHGTFTLETSDGKPVEIHFKGTA